jgi:hypothetical protein
MMRTVQLLLNGALLGAILAALPDVAWAQASSRASTATSLTTAKPTRKKSTPADEGIKTVAASAPSQFLPADDQTGTDPVTSTINVEKEPEFLQTLPHPPEQPRSLFQLAPALGPPPADLEQPYLMYDPLLDPPQWPQPGWFCDAQAAIVSPYVANEMRENVITGLGTPVFVQLGASRLNWTAAPRFELGYRLPSGFGEFSISDTGMTSNGSESFIGPNGPATRASALQFNYTDFDYQSREFTPWPNWEMKWRAGIRVAESNTTTTFSQPFAQAAAGSGILAAQQSNATLGVGPHFAVELERHFDDCGFSWVGKIDLADNYTMIRQRYAATTTTATPTGLDNGVTIDRFQNQVIILNVQVGLAWRPESYPNSRFFVGYLEETWWNALANNNSIQLGQFYYQGVVLRASWNF